MFYERGLLRENFARAARRRHFLRQPALSFAYGEWRHTRLLTPAFSFEQSVICCLFLFTRALVETLMSTSLLSQTPSLLPLPMTFFGCPRWHSVAAGTHLTICRQWVTQTRRYSTSNLGYFPTRDTNVSLVFS